MMAITSLEVIRGNTDAVAAVVGEVLELTYGDTLRITVAIEYQGPALSFPLYGAIGNRLPFPEYVGGFDEILHGEATLELPACYDFTPFSAYVDIPITEAIDPGKGEVGEGYDIYCKIIDHEDAGRPEVDNVITIGGIPPDYQLIQDTVYHWSYVYEGPAEVCTFEFKLGPEQIPGTEWLGKKIVDHFVSELKKEKSKLLWLKVWENKTPIFTTDYIVEVGASASPIGWTPIIYAVLGIIGLFAILFVITRIYEMFFKPAPLSEELKKTMSRETLILMANDFEEFLERPITPVEELDKKSDQELRDYCDQLAVVIVPGAPVSKWWLLGAAAVAVAGIATYAYYAKGKKEVK